MSYVVKHQHGGIGDQFVVFTDPPTEQQLIAEKARLDAIYGEGWVLAMKALRTVVVDAVLDDVSPNTAHSTENVVNIPKCECYGRIEFEV
jgi:16S rRNA G966 N2-methylase RsmD